MRFPVAALSLAATFTPSLARSSAVNASAFVSSNGDTQILGTSSKQDAPFSSTSRKGSSVDSLMTDPIYPGTAVERLNNVRLRVAEISKNNDLNGPWEDVRRRILWAGGLRDLSNAIPGKGYTGHSFSDYNHVDLTCMVENVSDNENDGRVKRIALGNQLGEGIRLASLPELGPGGSWSTCAIGCNKEPPQDVAHLQFRARIAFKLVWVPNENFDSFVLVDDDGKLLAKGKPSNTDELPPMRERQLNYRIVEGSKYAFEADKLARSVAAE